MASRLLPLSWSGVLGPWSVALVLLVSPAAGLADDPDPSAAGSNPAPVAPQVERRELMTEVVVIGSSEAVDSLTGAGTYIDAEDFRARGYDDIHRALREAPGVYLREEDGYGLFPNVSLRGVDTQRTSKLTVMEDGVPTAPATYSSPEAYYTPTSGRMSGLEVLKGSSQIRFGPHTTGGVINYRSTPIPEGLAGRISVLYGSDNELRQHSHIGNSWSTDFGQMGFVAEYYFRRTDGFKSIDAGAGLGNSDSTGFRKGEPMLKLFFEPDTERYHYFEGKIGFSELDADETYLGLTDTDFSADPDRRYVASHFDEMDTKHMRSYLRHVTELGPEVLVTTTAYYNTFKRNWYKLQGDGAALAENTENGCWLGVALGGTDCSVDGGWEYRNNRRKYYLAGVESFAEKTLDVGETSHSLTFGARFHQDRVKRDQDDFTYVQSPDGSIDFAASFSEGPCSGGCRWEESRAWSFFAQDRVEIGALTVQPGVRFEKVLHAYEDTSSAGKSRDSDDLAYWAGGVGARYALRDDLSVFGGVHRGVSPPGPRAEVRGRLREETSMGYELGARWHPSSFIDLESTLFYTDFDDLIVVANLGSGGSENDENVGDVNTYGVELGASVDVGAWQGWSFANPWRLALTLTNAELDGDSSSRDIESIFSGGRDGNDVPYIPDYQVSLGTALEFERASFRIDALWVDETYSTATEQSRPIDPVTGEPDFNFGTTDSYFVVDLSARYQLSETIAISAFVQNLFDEEYIVSRHPIGPRPGKDRTLSVAVDYDF